MNELFDNYEYNDILSLGGETLIKRIVQKKVQITDIHTQLEIDDMIVSSFLVEFNNDESNNDNESNNAIDVFNVIMYIDGHLFSYEDSNYPYNLQKNVLFGNYTTHQTSKDTIMSYQPNGIKYLGKDTIITINELSNDSDTTSIKEATFTFFCYDMLIYSATSYYLMSSQNVGEELAVNPPTREDSVAYEIDIIYEDIGDDRDAGYVRDNSRDDDIEFIYSIIKYSHKMGAKRRKITDIDDNMCVINFVPIEIGEYYYKCNSCKKLSEYESGTKWILKHKTCPHCRLVSKEIPDLYLNA